MIDFKVPRLKDSILIDTKEWVQNANSPIEIRRMSGRTLPTYISEIKEINAERGVLKNVLKKGDTVLLTKVASDIAQYRSFAIKDGDKRYFDLPIMQVLGVFKDSEMSFSSFQMVFDKILIKKIERKEVQGLFVPNQNTMMGEVVKTGWCYFDEKWNSFPLKVKVGDKVLIRDNVTTEVILSGETYYATNESMVVGIFKGSDESLAALEVINESILLEPYIPERAFYSDFLTPDLDYENEDVSNFYNRDLFKIEAIDNSLTKFKKDDIILVDRNMTNYVYLNNKKYFLITGTDCVEAKIESKGG